MKSKLTTASNRCFGAVTRPAGCRAGIAIGQTDRFQFNSRYQAGLLRGPPYGLFGYLPSPGLLSGNRVNPAPATTTLNR